MKASDEAKRATDDVETLAIFCLDDIRKHGTNPLCSQHWSDATVNRIQQAIDEAIAEKDVQAMGLNRTLEKWRMAACDANKRIRKLEERHKALVLAADRFVKEVRDGDRITVPVYEELISLLPCESLGGHSSSCPRKPCECGLVEIIKGIKP